MIGGRRTSGTTHQRGVDSNYRPFPMDPSRQARSQDVSCYSYVKENARQTAFQEFETAHQKRIRNMRNKQASVDSSQNFVPRYGPNNNGTGSVTNGVHSSRPATGIDLALGLNGYSDKMLSGLEADKVKARIPSTLQPLDDEDEQRRAAVRRSREAESEKWESIRKEVDARRAQEQEMERNFVQQAKDQMVRENNGEVREEISKQLDKSVVKDWDYQLEFKKKRAEEAKLAEMAMAQREKQVLFDADCKEDAEFLRKQRQMHESREAERNSHLEAKFKKEFVTDGLNRIENAAYIEDRKTQQVEDTAAQEALRLDQKHKREFLQGQISYQHEKERDEQNRDFTDKATKDAQNVNLNGAHKLQTQEEKQQNANQTAGYIDYQSKLSQAQGREIDRRDYLFEREQKVLKDSAVASSNQEKYLRKVHQQNAYNDIKDQIREREAAAAHDRDVVQRQEQERRLESELKLKAVINEEKEQKSKDAEEYRKFLLGQMQEKRDKGGIDNLRNNVFLHHRRLCENQRQEELDKAVGDVDVNAN